MYFVLGYKSALYLTAITLLSIVKTGGSVLCTYRWKGYAGLSLVVGKPAMEQRRAILLRIRIGMWLGKLASNASRFLVSDALSVASKVLQAADRYQQMYRDRRYVQSSLPSLTLRGTMLFIHFGPEKRIACKQFSGLAECL